jgi:hypothetical protein
MNIRATPIFQTARPGPVAFQPTPRSIGYSYHNGATLGGNIPSSTPPPTFGQGASPSPGGFLGGFATGSLYGAGTIPYTNTNVYAGSGRVVQNPGSSTISGNRPAPILTRAVGGLFS